MCPSPPTEKEQKKFASFPMVYFFVGEPSKSSHLHRAGILRADRIVLTNLSETGISSISGEDETLKDSATIMISNLIHRICEEAGVKKHIVTDLLKQSNIRFLAPNRKVRARPRMQTVTSRSTPTKPKRADTSNDIYYNPVFASGRVLTSMMLESILSNAYHQPSVVNIFNIFCGVRYKIDFDIDSMLEYEPSNLCYISVPKDMEGKSFGVLYRSLCESFGIVPIGILREEMNPMLGNKYPFVYTNPPNSMILLRTDLVYVLANPNQVL